MGQFDNALVLLRKCIPLRELEVLFTLWRSFVNQLEAKRLSSSTRVSSPRCVRGGLTAELREDVYAWRTAFRGVVMIYIFPWFCESFPEDIEHILRPKYRFFRVTL